MELERGRYLVASLPGWILAAVLAWAAVRWIGLNVWLAAGVVAVWIVKDLLVYPAVRQFYRTEPAEKRMLGEQGVALSTLDPAGFVRVHGEIWQARAADGTERIGEGARVTVRELQGLLLIVDAA